MPVDFLLENLNLCFIDWYEFVFNGFFIIWFDSGF